jgi:exosortase
VQLQAATLGAELFLARTAFLISLVGVIVTLGGARLLRPLGFPLFLLLFMIPIPAIIFNQITLPMQLFASAMAEATLNLVGIPVLREGNILELPQQRLSVVEACSGIRSLLSLSFLALVYAYFFDNKAWMRGVLLMAAAPIAIVANSGRVILTGILGEYNKTWADGFFHAVEGWVIFLVAGVALATVHLAIQRVVSPRRGGR